MKNIFLLLSLLASLTFYGQNSINQKPLVIEGYVFDDTCFYEKQGDKCLGREGTEYTDKIKNEDLLKVLDTTKLFRGVYVKFEAVRVGKPHDEEPCICHTKLLVNEILEVGTKPTLYEELQSGTIKHCGKSEYVELDGFLINQFEGTVFHEKKDDTLLPAIWFMFEDGLWKRDSLMDIVGRRHGPYGNSVKIGGIKYTEAPFNFGCRVYNLPSGIEISKIIEVDTTYTLHDFYIEEYRKKGYYLSRRGDTLKAPEDFKVGKTYTFKGTEYIYDDEELDSTSAQYNIKAKEDFTEDEIIRYSVKVEPIDAVTIKVTVTRLDDKKESKYIILTWAFGGFRGEYESSYISKETVYIHGDPKSVLTIYTDVNEEGKRTGYFYFVDNKFKWSMEIIEQ